MSDKYLIVAFIDKHSKVLLWGYESMRPSNPSDTRYIQVPNELQEILDKKFDFQSLSHVSNQRSEQWKQTYKFCNLWMNPKTRKLAELLYL